MVFVGYGVTAPERGWDDFGDVDLNGKIAVFLVNDPDFEAAPGEPAAGRFGGRAMTYYGRWTYKFEEAARRGAIGALVIHESEAAGYGWNTVQAPARRELQHRARPGRAPAGAAPGLDPARRRRRPVPPRRPRFRGGEAAGAQRRASAPIDLGATFSADLPVTSRRVESHNVIARLPGARHPDETIMFSGHWDAYGIGPRRRARRHDPQRRP